MSILHFSGPWKNVPEMAPNGAGSCFFPTNPDLADILGDTDFDSDDFSFFRFFGSHISGFPIPRFLNFQIPRFPDAGDDGDRRTLRSQPEPSPNAKYVARTLAAMYFSIFPAYAENCLKWHDMGPGGFLFLLIQTLPKFWATRILILISCFLFCSFVPFSFVRKIW